MFPKIGLSLKSHRGAGAWGPGGGRGRPAEELSDEVKQAVCTHRLTGVRESGTHSVCQERALSFYSKRGSGATWSPSWSPTSPVKSPKYEVQAVQSPRQEGEKINAGVAVAAPPPAGAQVAKGLSPASPFPPEPRARLHSAMKRGTWHPSTDTVT